MARPNRYRAYALRVIVLVFAAYMLAGALPLGAQQSETRWNSTRVLNLLEQARQRRLLPLADTALHNYRAQARASVYFLVEPEGGVEPVLLRADQVALELHWRQPDRAVQVIKGMRSKERVPIRNFAYYLDRYTVMLNGLGDRIQVGSGLDVRDVQHPLAPGAEATYDYLLADSTTIQAGLDRAPIRIYRIDVRPRDPARPALVGSLYVERAQGDLVRMTFTFTPASYIDRRNERVEVELENGLWQQRYWLPREQRLLVRREIPELDLGIGTAIRAVVTISDYEFNQPVPPGLFEHRATVFTMPPDSLTGFVFEQDLLARLEAAGVQELGSLESLLDRERDRVARAALKHHMTSGLPALRLHVPALSDIVRFNRSEGLVTALGLTRGFRSGRVDALGGYSWGEQRPRAALSLGVPAGRFDLSLSAYLNRTAELPPGPVNARLFSTVSALAFGLDPSDIVFTSGARIGVAGGRNPMFDVAVLAERERPAALVQPQSPVGGASLGSVLGGSPGTRVAVQLGARHRASFLRAASDLHGRFEAGLWEGAAYGRMVSTLQLSWHTRLRTAGATLSATVGAVQGQRAPQHLFYLGGPDILPAPTPGVRDDQSRRPAVLPSHGRRCASMHGPEVCQSLLPGR